MQPSSTSMEAFLPAGKGVVSDTYIECCRPGENQGFLVCQLMMLFQEKTVG